MSFRLITASCLALSVISSGAFAANEKIPCPDVTTVQLSSDKIDVAEKYGTAYVAYTSDIAFKEGTHSWYVGAANISAASADEALEAGKDLVQNISFKKNENAIKQDEFFYCLYGNGDVVAVTGNFGVRGSMFKMSK